jgi:hypothetical protein
MNDMLVGVVGCIGLFTFVFVWTWTEDYLVERKKRKYDEQIAKYDRWKKKSYSR